MLKTIHIKNFALIDELTIDLNRGFTVLTGETGAGKSIWVDALLLALGARADNNVIRVGKERAEISAGFNIEKVPSARQWLIANEFDDDECILTRIINRESPSRGMINGRPVTLQQLQALGEHLLNVHSQHQYQLLLKADWQLSLLDDFADHAPLTTQVYNIHQTWKQKFNEREKLQQLDQQKDKADWLRYQITELEQLAISSEELANLNEKHKRLNHADQFITHTESALSALSEADASAVNQLQQAMSAINQITKHDASLKNVAELINNAIIHTEEAVDEIHHYRDRLNLDPEELQTLEQRLTNIHEIARKHRCRPEQLPEIKQTLTAQLEELATAEQQIKQLTDEINKLVDDYQRISQQLSQSRQQAAKTFADAISKKIKTIGMPQGKFNIAFYAQTGMHASGNEKIEFLFSANPGQPPAPLKKIASGGELSRVSLALHVISAEKTAIPSLIFDEVDAGIGGKTADAVGQLLKQLGQHAQVLCITHLPQVAALGQQHFKVEKHSNKTQTNTVITSLTKQQRVEEIARMLGGAEITQTTREHAVEMLETN